jgi:hypothetical protein
LGFYVIDGDAYLRNQADKQSLQVPFHKKVWPDGSHFTSTGRELFRSEISLRGYVKSYDTIGITFRSLSLRLPQIIKFYAFA